MDKISILIIIKGHYSVNLVHGVTILVFCNCLIMAFICTNFEKNILNGFRVIKRTQFKYFLI